MHPTDPNAQGKPQQPSGFPPPGAPPGFPPRGGYPPPGQPDAGAPPHGASFGAPPPGGQPHPGPPPPGAPFGAPPPPKKSGGKAVAIGVAIALIALLLVCGGIGIAGYLIYASAEEETPSTRDALSDVVDYRKTAPAVLTRNHQVGRIAYPISPPVGGDHSAAWQNCEGDVYSAEVPKEHAVHSLEHGAVWVTYRPGLSQGQVDKLAGKVRGEDYTLMSAFISKYARTATMEPGAPCGSGVTTTGSTPRGS